MATSTSSMRPGQIQQVPNSVGTAPQRLVWGSDWPHPGMPDNNKPDDAVLFDLLGVWAPDEVTRRRILIENPEKLYGFPKTV